MDKQTYITKLLDENDYYNGFLELLSQLTIVDADKISYKDFCNHLKKISSKIIVLQRLNDNKIIATGSLFIENKFIHNLGSVAHIEDVVVLDEYRLNGLGKKIITELVQMARDMNCYKIILDCSDENIEFYKKLGFIKKAHCMAIYNI